MRHGAWFPCSHKLAAKIEILENVSLSAFEWAKYDLQSAQTMVISGNGSTSGHYYNRMLIDIVFFGLPIVLSACLAAHAYRDQEPRYWLPAFSFFAYCVFYITGGRDVILYLIVALLMGGGMLNSGAGGAL